MNALPLGLGVLVFTGALALSALLVWISIRIAHRYDFVDLPDGVRKIQNFGIPKLGGVAIAIAFSASSLITIGFGDNPEVLVQALWFLIPALLAASIGYLDDKRGLPAWLRLVLQAIVGLGTAYAVHDVLEITGNTLLDSAITIAWVMVLINGVNLLDNSDGLAGATVLIAGLTAAAVAIISGQYLIGAWGLALAGTAGGFLVHNWNPARVYMGDSGAYFLGTMLATVTLTLNVSYQMLPWTLLIPILIASLPMLDTSFVVISRLRRGIHPFTAGRDHLSHRLQATGMSVRVSVLTLEVILLVASAAAIAITLMNT